MSIVKRRNCCLLAMLFSLIGVLIIFLLLGIFPFGNETMVTGDLGGIYLPLAAGLRNAEFFSVFSFTKELGGGIQGLSAYFPISPYMLLFKLVSIENLNIFFTIVVAIKQVLAAGTMCFYLCKKTSASYISALLGFSYSFMSYNFAYAQNTMWIDNIILLPLLLYALDLLIYESKWFSYCLLLFLSILSNYYTSYMICIFLVLYFLWEVMRKEKVNLRKAGKLGVRFAFFSALSVGMSSFMMIPMILQTVNSKDIGGGIKGLAFNATEIFRQFVFIGFTIDKLEVGPPLIYCGYLCIVSVFIYFSSKTIKKRERIVSLALLCVLILSFLFAPVNRIWHMFRDPVWFPFRNSFIFPALCILLSALAFENITKLSKKTIIVSFVSTVILMLGILISQYKEVSIKKIIVSLLALIVVLLLIYFFSTSKSKKLKRLAAVTLCAFVFLELTVNGYYITSLFEKKDYIKTKEYIESINSLRTEITSTGFYRLEKDSFLSLNDPMYLGYNGLNHFSSLKDSTSEQILKDLGYSGLYKSGTYATMPANSLLNIEYIISETEVGSLGGYKYLRTDKEHSIYKSEYTLPFAFYIDSIDVNLSSNPFSNINTIYSAIIGRDVLLFESVEYLKDNEDYTVKSSGEYLFYSWFIPKNDGSFLKVEGKEFGRVNLLPGTPQVLPLGLHDSSFSFSLNGYDISIYRLDVELFLQVIAEINEQKVECTISKNCIDIFPAREGYVLLSMPYYEDWTVIENGKQSNIISSYNNFASVKVSKKNSKVSLKYRPYGFYLGFGVSTASILLLLLLVILSQRKKLPEKAA